MRHAHDLVGDSCRRCGTDEHVNHGECFRCASLELRRRLGDIVVRMEVLGQAVAR